MTGYVLMGILAVVIIVFMHFYYKRREQKLLDNLEQMLTEGRTGTFRAKSISEAKLSSVENSMSRFLEDSCIANANIQEQKMHIQTLISDISHQTVTPVSNIMLYSQLLEECLVGSEFEPNIMAIREQAEKLDFLIGSLVKTSRLENGIVKTVPQVSNVKEMLCHVIAQAVPRAEEKGIVIRMKETEPDCQALFDVKWTAEAIYNILDNAVKYTEDGGEIHVRIIPYPMFCRIDITDTGMGLTETEIPKIFGRFYRSERAADEKGVGLGLYLAREIIRNENGYIKVTSALNKGTTFSVFLAEARG